MSKQGAHLLRHPPRKPMIRQEQNAEPQPLGTEPSLTSRILDNVQITEPQ
jgi:hypothetical protein